METNPLIDIRGTQIARNSALNLAGEMLPLVAAVVAIPFVVRGLGRDGFGILSLAWVVLGYFTHFDLGMGRATSKFVAEYLAGGKEQEVRALVWNFVKITGGLGVLGSITLTAVSPVLSEKIFNIPPGLIGEARNTFHILALAIPVVLISTTLRGVLAAVQRFDLINVVKVPTSVLNYLIPAATAPFGVGLTSIVMLLVVARLGAAVAYVLLTVRVLPVFGPNLTSKRSAVRPLLLYAGWVTVITIVGPINTYLDRFLIGSLVTVVALSYYTPAYEMVVRLWILPSSLSATLFPAFSTLGAMAARKELERLFARSVKHLFLIVAPLALVLVVFAQDVFRFWLGADFAEKSSSVMQILAVGIVINSLGWVPASLLMGLGRPDVRAQLLLFELPIYTGLSFILIRNMGINGAAMARALIGATDALLLFMASWKLLSLSPRLLIENGFFRAFLTICSLAAATAVVGFLSSSFLGRAVLTGILLIAFAILAWLYALDQVDRNSVCSMFRVYLSKLRVYHAQTL